MLRRQRVHASLYSWIGQVIEERARPLVLHSVEVAVDSSKNLGSCGACGPGFGERSDLAVWAHRVRFQVGLREAEAGLKASKAILDFHQLRARQQVDSGELHEASETSVLQELLLLAVVVRAEPSFCVKS